MIFISPWHRKKMMEYPDQSNNILIVSEPDLSNNCFISKNNDIFFKIDIDINAIFSKKNIIVNIGDREFEIYGKELYLTHETQIKKYKNEGILKIDKDNIFDQSQRGDIYIEISLVENKNQ